jgi:hypothetical protein
MSQLRLTKNWISTNSLPRRILIDGDRRLTATVAIGYVFSAVSGFTVETAYHGELYQSDAHATDDTPDYPIEVDFRVNPSSQLVVSIDAAMVNMADDVEYFVMQSSVEPPSFLHLRATQAIISPPHANRAIIELKSRIRQAIRESGTTEIHLFVSSPTPLMLLLGHRLNALVPVQCYEWIGGKQYIPTCYLP